MTQTINSTTQTEFVVYLPNGSIVRTGSCPSDMVQLQAHREGEMVLVGNARFDLNYVLDGQIKVFTQEEQQTKLDIKPGFIWKMPERIVVDTRTLNDIKTVKWQEIKQARDAAEYAGFVWDGSTFDSDAISQARIQGAVQLAGMVPGFVIDWTLADNSVRTLSAGDTLAVGIALGQHVGAQFDHARQLRVLIDNAQAQDLPGIAW